VCVKIPALDETKKLIQISVGKFSYVLYDVSTSDTNKLLSMMF